MKTSRLTTVALTRALVPALILSGAIVCSGALYAMSPTTERHELPERAAPVTVMQATLASEPARVLGTGAVIAAQHVSLIPQVGGTITWLHPELRKGTRLNKGDVLARVDSRDYTLALQQAQSQVEAAKLALRIEEGEGEAAQRERELLGKDASQDGSSDLALRKPHLVSKQQALRAAESQEKQARLNLERTSLRAPFNAIITAESIDLGQLVGANASVATLVGTDAFWIEVSVRLEELAYLSVPGVNGDEGSPATITQKLSNTDSIVREGRILGMAGQLDPETRTATVIVQVDNPLQTADGGLPLMTGAYVNVQMIGRDLGSTFAVPRSATVDGSFVWLADANDRLEKRRVDFGWREGTTLFVTDGLSAGDRVVTSPMPMPVEGMLLAPAAE